MTEDERVARISKIMTDVLDDSLSMEKCAELCILAAVDAGMTSTDLQDALHTLYGAELNNT